MKLFNALVGIILLFFVTTALPTDVNGRFTIVSIDSLKFTVKLQVNTNTGSDDLGGATIVFDFDTTALSFTNSPVKNVDYVSHNFCGGNYSPATVTRPMKNKIWVNIDLPFVNNNNGTVVAANPAWTDVVTIHFDVLDLTGAAHLTWLTSSPFWGIYDANNSTLWQTGTFTDLFGPLPVELVSFTGKLLSNKNVFLEWKTASELNHYGFEIEKAPSKSPPKGETPEEWVTIGFVESYGNPGSLVEYSFTDVTLHSSTIVKYRLKSIDNDGSFQYSDIVEINTLPLSYELSQNYPNPFNPSTKIKYSIPSVGTQYTVSVQIKVFDILGNEVAILVDEEKEPGGYEVTFNSHSGEVGNLPAGRHGLASGIYIYRLQTPEFTSTKKMVLLR
jgi:hypothetical protein